MDETMCRRFDNFGGTFLAEQVTMIDDTMVTNEIDDVAGWRADRYCLRMLSPKQSRAARR